MARLTQAQRDILSLYRRGLRLIRTKPEASRPHFTLYLRHFFRMTGGTIPRRDFAAIEYFHRRAHRLIEDTFQQHGVKDIRLPAAAQLEMARRGYDYWWRNKAPK